MKKIRLFIYVYIIILLLLFTSCNGITQESSGLSMPESPRETTQAAQEDPAEELSRQMDEIQRALKFIDPTQKLENDAHREMLRQKITDTIAGLGYPVVQYHRDMPHYEQVVAFFDCAGRGENAFVTVYSVNVYETASVNASLYGHDETGFYEQNLFLVQNEDFSWIKNLYDMQRIRSLELTANGNLMENADEQGGGYGFRVIPQHKELTDAYWKYLWLIDVQPDGVLSRNWNQAAGTGRLAWENIFESIWERENDAQLINEDNPFYTEITTDYGKDSIAVVPSDVVENLMQKYFDVSASDLREIMTGGFSQDGPEMLYDPQSDAYRIWGWRGGGYKPTAEVWGITDNPDGSVSLDIAHVSLEFGNDGNLYSTLTVMPQADGGFHYISNIFSEDTVKGKVEYALKLAESANFLHKGGLATVGETEEKNGYHFAAIDIEQPSYRDQMKLGGLSSVESLERWFRLIFDKDAAEKYIQQMLTVPLYIDGTKDGENALFVNQDVKGSAISPGEWTMEDFAVLENTPDIIKVQMKLKMPDGSKTGSLTLVPGQGQDWLLTDSYATEGWDSIEISHGNDSSSSIVPV